MELKKSVDESWKESVASEKEKEIKPESGAATAPQSPEQEKISPQEVPSSGDTHDAEGEINFMSYITSLAVQAMIFLGELPNPLADHKVEINLKQTKLLIDTLIILRDKTEGNRTREEDDFLKGSIYELQMRYVEKSSAGKRTGTPS